MFFFPDVVQPTTIIADAVNQISVSEPVQAIPSSAVAVNTISSADLHICGSCNTQFTDIKTFIDHKQQGCHQQPQQVTSPESLNVPQAPPPSVITTQPTIVHSSVLSTAAAAAPPGSIVSFHFINQFIKKAFENQNLISFLISL